MLRSYLSLRRCTAITMSVDSLIEPQAIFALYCNKFVTHGNLANGRKTVVAQFNHDELPLFIAPKTTLIASAVHQGRSPNGARAPSKHAGGAVKTSKVENVEP